MPRLVLLTIHTKKNVLKAFCNITFSCKQACKLLKYVLRKAKTLFCTRFLRPYGPVCVLAKMVTLRPCVGVLRISVEILFQHCGKFPKRSSNVGGGQNRIRKINGTFHFFAMPCLFDFRLIRLLASSRRDRVIFSIFRPINYLERTWMESIFPVL